MKAVILLAGAGRRLHPLTLDRPKSLLPIGESTVLEHMLTKLVAAGVGPFVVVCGFMEETIRGYIGDAFPGLDVTYLTNASYGTTNTAWSLLAARPEVGDEAFLKLDGDVIFEPAILTRLLAQAEGPSYVCTDRTAVGEEVIKVVCDERGRVSEIGNGVAVADAIGESIGIERIGRGAAPALFRALAAMVALEEHRQSYYEVAYDALVRQGVPFASVDVTGLRWVEMDDLADHDQAQAWFAAAGPGEA